MKFKGSQEGYKETGRQTHREFILLKFNCGNDEEDVYHKILINVLDFTKVSTTSSNQNLHPMLIVFKLYLYEKSIKKHEPFPYSLCFRPIDVLL